MGKITKTKSKVTPEQLRQIIDLILQGHDILSIQQWATDEMGEDVAASAATLAREYFTEVATASPTITIGFCIETFRDLYKQAVAVGDLNTARACLKDLRDTALKMADYEIDYDSR